MDETALKHAILRVSSASLWKSSFYHCAILIYHLSMSCVIVLIRQHIVTTRVLNFGASSPNRHLVAYRATKFLTKTVHRHNDVTGDVKRWEAWNLMYAHRAREWRAVTSLFRQTVFLSFSEPKRWTRLMLKSVTVHDHEPTVSAFDSITYFRDIYINDIAPSTLTSPEWCFLSRDRSIVHLARFSHYIWELQSLNVES